jgi:hypothetical protein
MTLEGVVEDERALKRIVETTKNKGTLGFRGGLKHVTKVEITMISRLESQNQGDSKPL